MKWTKENIEKANEAIKNLPLTIKDEDVLAEANKQLGTEFTEIRIKSTVGDFGSEKEYKESPNFWKEAKITLETCPHCDKWYPSALCMCNKRSVSECVPTYSKEMKRYYRFELVMCPECRKDYAKINFKDDRYERNGKKTDEYRIAIAFNPNEERYPDELIIP